MSTSAYIISIIFVESVVFAAVAKQVVRYLRSGGASEDVLPRLKLRDQLKVRRNIWQLKRRLEPAMRLVVLAPDNREADTALLSIQLSWLLGRALLKRDARLALAVQLAMLRAADAGHRVVVPEDHRKRLEAACWN